MENLEHKENNLSEIKLSDFEGIEGMEEWLSSIENIPSGLASQIRELPKDMSLGQFLKKARNLLFAAYGAERNKANSFADSRFTPLDKMIERCMVSCGAMTNIFGTILREMGVPVKYIHGEPLGEKGRENRHSWLAIYDPIQRSWFEADPTHPDFGMRPNAKRIREYHNWNELEKDYNEGNF